MSVDSKPSVAFFRKRLAIAFVLSSCMLLGACDDDKAPDARTASAIPASTNSSATDHSAAEVPPSTSPALTVQTPARPASSADTALSAGASAPLATPVIHTVD